MGQCKKKSTTIEIIQTALINIKTKSSGAFKSATFKSLGAQVNFGQNKSGSKEYYGGAVITGKSIKAKDVPINGVLYFSQDWNGDGLYRLDLSTGAATHVGKSGVEMGTVGLAYDPDTGEAALIGDSGIDLKGGLAFAPGVNP